YLTHVSRYIQYDIKMCVCVGSFEKRKTKKKMNTGGESINKLFKILNEIINKGCLTARDTNLSNRLLEKLKTIENCATCKDNSIKGSDLSEFHKLIKEIENGLVELERKKEEQKKKQIINELIYKSIKIDHELDKKVLCEVCKEKEIEKLTDKC